MHVRSFVSLALVLALPGLTGCSGGGATGGIRVPVTCGGTVGVVPTETPLCLANCNLGCSNGRCELTDIAQNQILVFIFNQDVNPLTVGPSTIQLRTASGEVPVGDFLVNGNRVEFKPQILVVGGSSFFGFRAGETYTLNMPAGDNEPNAVRSTAGAALAQSLRCTLNVTLGIVDLNQSPPLARMVVPAQTSNVPFDTFVRLEFNEIIDITPFLNATPTSNPVVFSLRRTQLTPTGGKQCNPLTPPTPLPGSTRVDIDPARDISILTFRPTQPLPCDICVEVTVTDRVRDLSGRPASTQIFQFTTQETTGSVELESVEPFDDDTMLDRDASSGDWIGGRGTFGTIGGDGGHGDFDAAAIGQSLGVINGKNAWLIDTDSTTIPAALTLSGQAETVTDGRFRFAQMVVPRDVLLRFAGSNPPQFTARGKIEIAGHVELMGESVAAFVPPTAAGPMPGQPGGAGGIFAAAGGRGGDRCQGTGSSAAFFGQDGGDCRVAAGHAYAARTVGTRGRGSPLFPASGLNANVVYSSTLFGFSFQAAAGASGGGYDSAGGDGRVIPVARVTGMATGPNTANTITDSSQLWSVNEFSNREMQIVSGLGAGQTRTIQGNNGNTITVTLNWTTVPDATSVYLLRSDFVAPPVTGGIAFPVLPIPAGALSSQHFLVGGSGGGGGGSNPLFANNITQTWAPGSGGGGGGGAVGLRAGSLIRITTDGRVFAQGGSSGQNLGPPTAVSLPAPGGGGSGGSVLMQSGDLTDIQGLVDVRGGTGGVLIRATSTQPPSGGSTEVRGGSGANGFLRLEVPQGASPSMLPNVQPPAVANNVGQLVEQDSMTGFQSRFYSTGQAFGPIFVRYEITAVINGTTVLFSDDPALGQRAVFGSSPIRALFQSGRLDPVTGEVESTTIRPWREFVRSQGAGNAPSLADDSQNGFRFLIIFDRSMGQTVEIDSVKVVYRFC